MKTKKNLSEYSIEELLETKKKIKTISIVLGLVMLLAIIFLVYSAIQTKNYAFMAIGVSSMTTLLPLIMQLSKIEKEIKSR